MTTTMVLLLLLDDDGGRPMHLLRMTRCLEVVGSALLLKGEGEPIMMSARGEGNRLGDWVNVRRG